MSRPINRVGNLRVLMTYVVRTLILGSIEWSQGQCQETIVSYDKGVLKIKVNYKVNEQSDLLSFWGSTL